MSAGLLIISNRLPVSVKRGESGKLEFYPSAGGLATGLSSYALDKKNKWIGWPGIASDELSDDEKNAVISGLREHNCYPVFLSQSQLDEFYNGYSNSILWPLFHEATISTQARKNESRYWEAYERVNQLFADAVFDLGVGGENLWVHDYQLMLLPSLLRSKRPHNKIGFFLHIPFPLFEGWSSLAHRNELIDGLLGADLIGFHTESYVRNFMQASNENELVLTAPNKIILPSRVVRVTEFPMGIDYDKFAKATKDSLVRKELSQLKVKYFGKKLILTVDRLDPTKGLVERALAYQTLLRQHKTLHRKVVLFMLAVPSRTDIDEYKQLKDRLETLIAEINEEFGTSLWQPIEYLYDSVPFALLTALYQRADIAFIAPLRDGMNLVAKEYLASKPNKNGVLILSKTAGAAEELKDAILVDHAEPASLVRGLYDALTMPRSELQRRVTTMQQQLARSTVHVWAKGFMQSLKDAAVASRRTLILTKQRQQLLQRAFTASTSKLLLLDYDGVLAPFSDNPADTAPTNDVKAMLVQLAKQPHTDVVLVSGRNKQQLTNWFKDVPIALVAEHGAFSRDAHDRTWHRHTQSTSTDWMQLVVPYFHAYAKKTPGATVEIKQTSVVWHYRAAKPFYAQKSLVQLKRVLKPFTETHGLVLQDGEMILENRDRTVHKGNAALPWLNKRPTFIMAIGDDITDEDLFDSIPEYGYSIKVGSGKTTAHYRVHDQHKAIQLLKSLLVTSN